MCISGKISLRPKNSKNCTHPLCKWAQTVQSICQFTRACTIETKWLSSAHMVVLLRAKYCAKFGQLISLSSATGSCFDTFPIINFYSLFQGYSIHHEYIATQGQCVCLLAFPFSRLCWLEPCTNILQTIQLLKASRYIGCQAFSSRV